MTSRTPASILLIALLAAAPALAEADRIGTQISAIWCNDGLAAGHADRITEITICQRDPAVPGPSQCTEFVDKVVFDFETENSRAKGLIAISVFRFDAAGELVDSFKGEAEVVRQRAHADIDIDRAMLPGEWLQAELVVPRSARKLVRRQCAMGSVTVLE